VHWARSATMGGDMSTASKGLGGNTVTGDALLPYNAVKSRPMCGYGQGPDSMRSNPGDDEDNEYKHVEHYPELVMDFLNGKYRDADNTMSGFMTRWEDEVYMSRGVKSADYMGPPPRIEVNFSGTMHKSYMEIVKQRTLGPAADTLAKRLYNDPIYTTTWKGLKDLPHVQRQSAVKQVYHTYLKQAIRSNTALQIDDCKGVLIALPVKPWEGSSIAPGVGSFAQLKNVKGVSPIPDPPEDVLRLSHIKARRMEGRAYVYIWALAVSDELPEEKQRDLWLALVHFVMLSAKRDNQHIVVEASTPQQVSLWEAVGFLKIEAVDVWGAENELMTWYCMVRPPTAPAPEVHSSFFSCGSRGSSGPGSAPRFCGARFDPPREPEGSTDGDHFGTERFNIEYKKDENIVPIRTPRGLTDFSQRGHRRAVHATNYMV